METQIKIVLIRLIDKIAKSTEILFFCDIACDFKACVYMYY